MDATAAKATADTIALTGTGSPTPVFSVIVPVYQVERYLRQCLDSLLAQDLRDIEVICIDDGSTDGSAAVLAEYAVRDSRLIVLTQANAGLSAARNAGINKACGCYILFVDADDLIAADTCSTLLNAFEHSSADIIAFGASLYPQGTTDPYLADLLSPRDVFYDGFQPELLFQENSHPFVWRTAYRRCFLNDSNLLFDQSIRYGEDAVFMFMAYPRSRRTLLISQKLYSYRVLRDESMTLTRRMSNLQRVKEHVEIVKRILADWSELGLLDKYASWLWEWVLEFITYDIATASRLEQAGLIAEARAVIEPYLSLTDLAGLAVRPASRSILRALLSAPAGGRPQISWLQLQRYRLARRLSQFAHRD